MNEVDKLSNRIKELELANEQLLSVLDNIPTSIYWKDGNGVYLGRNQYAADKTYEDKIIATRDKNAATGKTDYDFLTKEVADQFRRNDIECMKTGKIVAIEEFCTLPDGRCLIQLSQKRPWKDKNGKIIGIVGNTVDITDRKRAEQLEKEKEIAEKLTKFSNLIAGSIAHELRTPLTVVNLKMDMLDEIVASAKLPPEEGSTCRLMIKEVKQIVKNSTHVIGDMLLKIKSFATGQLHHHDFVTASIATDVEEFLALFPFEFEHEKELIKLKGFDSLSNRFKYTGDHVLTQHVLSNLLRNALHVIRIEKKGNITIELLGGRASNKLIFRDTASGIPADFIAKIFDQFETKKTTHGGTGLGLAFCKMVMESYGGSIACDSKEDEYTEFVLSFPRV